MYLQKLEIQGFKSFANKSLLEFLPPDKKGKKGIASIVGPNGSGKSNVADAIRWVLGEQSVKTLRGKKSEDVIFSGSDKKARLGFAEVSLFLNNEDGGVPIDYTELVITRRLYRDGDSEYLLNKNKVRLTDILMLLAKANFGQKTYSVIGQGMVDHILVAPPSERKEFFDEAVGVKQYQIKRDQALNKLKATEENLDQTGLVLQELEPRLRYLGRQVKRLEKRQEIELALRELQEKYYASYYNINKKELDKLQGRLKEVRSQYGEHSSKLEEIQKELAALAQGESRQEIFSEWQSKHQKAVGEKNDLERRLSIVEGRMQTEYNKAGLQNIGWAEGKLKELKNKKSEVANNLSEAEEDLSEIRRSIVEKEKKFDELDKKRDDARREIALLETQMFQGGSGGLSDSPAMATVRAVMENKKDIGEVYGALAQLAEADSKYALALDVAGGSYISSLVVEDDETAKRSIEFLRRNRLGVGTFLPLNKIRPFEISETERERFLEYPGVVGFATDLIDTDEKYDGVFSFVFKNTLVVESARHAQQIGIGKIRMVTLEGDLMEKSGVMKGGFRHKRSFGLSFGNKASLNGASEIKGSLEEEKKKLEELDMKMSQSQNILFTERAKKESLSGRIEFLTAEKESLDRNIEEMQRDLSAYKSDPKEYGEQLAGLGEEKKGLEEKIKAREEDIAAIGEKIRQINQEEDVKRKRVFELQASMQEAQSELNKVTAGKNDLEIMVARLDTKQENLSEEARHELNAEIQSIIERRPPLVEFEQLGKIQEDIQKQKYQLSLIGGIDPETMGEYEEISQRYDFLSSQVKDLEEAIGSLCKVIEELDEVIKKQFDRSFNKINDEFGKYFKMLFSGGRASLNRTKVEEPRKDEAEEEAAEGEEIPVKKQEKRSLVYLRRAQDFGGIDISACPPGKKLSGIGMLSGGERALTSIALICAIISNNPSPFVVLDEVDAALDEANSIRFSEIIDEISKKTQFIVITHNRATMQKANVLYGVTMGDDGISRLLSVKLEEAMASSYANR